MFANFLPHLNKFGCLREFLSKLLKFGNNDIVGGVTLKWTGVVATDLSTRIYYFDDDGDVMTSMIKFRTSI